MSYHVATSYALPLPVHGKAVVAQYALYDDVYSVSEEEPSVGPGSGSGLASYGPSGMAASGSSYASYASSAAGDHDSNMSASSIDFQEYMQDRFANSFNPIPLDRSVAVQAQTSGKLNAKHRELLDLQKQAKARLARTRERFSEGMRDAREVRADLEWTQKKVTALKTKASRKHPKEFAAARARYPSPE